MKKDTKKWVFRVIAILLAVLMVGGSVYAIIYSIMNT